MASFFLILCSIILSTNLIEGASVAKQPNTNTNAGATPGQAEPPKFNTVFSTKPAYVAHFQTDAVNKLVTIGLEAETPGYAGFGFSPDGSMHNSELIMGGVDAEGKPYMGAYHVLDHTPRKFESNDWKLVHAEQNATHTTLLIHRPFTAGGHEIEKGEIFVIWSIGADDDTTQHHSERGPAKITLIPVDDAENVVDVHGRNVGDETDKTNENGNGSKRTKPKKNETETGECPPCDCDENQVKEEEDHNKSNKSWWYSSSSRRERASMSFTIISVLAFPLFWKF